MNDKRKILVVEDETSLAMMMVFLLTHAGYEVEAVYHVETAMQLAKDTAFDLITMDLNFPGTNGFELCKRFKRFPHLTDTPVIFVTDCATPENQRRALELGAADFIEKPFSASDFLARISACLKSQPYNESRLTRAGELVEEQRD